MVAGYILFRVKKAPNISRTINLLLWFVSISIMALLIFGVWDGELNVLMTSFYMSLGHTGKRIYQNLIEFLNFPFISCHQYVEYYIELRDQLGDLP